MEEISEEEQIEIASAYKSLITSQQTVLLSTLSRNMQPEISTAPFVRDDAGNFYIYISELAKHTTNLLDHPKAAILFIRPESESRNLFARERAVFQCCVSEVMPQNGLYTQQLAAMQEKFGEMVSMLRTLPDFHLFALRPESGQYVAGFGRAFSIDLHGDGLNHMQA